MGLDFKGVAAAALAQAPALLSEWIGGAPKGRDWFGRRKRDGGLGDSWSCNLDTGVWAHFAGDERGHDLISLYATLNGLSQGAAFDYLANRVGNPNGVRVLPAQIAAEPEDPPPESIPEFAPAILDHPQFGKPSRIDRYGNDFVVTRFDLPDGSKFFSQWTWRRGKWSNKGYGNNKPPFQAHAIKKHADVSVLVVEGEKCVSAVEGAKIRGLVPTTWAGGANAVMQTDWSLLEGREVVIWPDADVPGRAAAAKLAQRLFGKAKRIRVVNPNGFGEGWDVADAIDEGWDADRIVNFISEHAEETAVPITVAVPEPEPEWLSDDPSTHVTVDPPREESDSAPIVWSTLSLDRNEGGAPHPTLANASAIIQCHRLYKGHVWYDEFRGKVYHTIGGRPPAPWTDSDTRRITAQIQQSLKLPKFHAGLVYEGVLHAAECNAKNSLVEWLQGLHWDGNERLKNWLIDYAGVERNEYTEAVSVNWLVGMVARAFRPGCKMDNMPVLEGPQGLNKTTLLEVLGGEWYKAMSTEFGTKDFYQSLKGTWLVEIPDMSAFDRGAHTRILGILSTPVDCYRKSYGRIDEEHARTCVFAGTSENDEYLTDRRGRRRYWPIRCTEITLDSLRANREKLFAEAVHRYREGARWYVMPESADEEQMARVYVDPWQDKLLDYADHMWEQVKRSHEPIYVTTANLLVQGLDIPSSLQNHTQSMRVGAILRGAGWIKTRNKSFWYWKKVERNV